MRVVFLLSLSPRPVEGVGGRSPVIDNAPKKASSFARGRLGKGFDGKKCRRRLPPPHTSPLSSSLCVANVSVHVCDPLVKKKKEKEKGARERSV